MCKRRETFQLGRRQATQFSNDFAIRREQTEFASAANGYNVANPYQRFLELHLSEIPTEPFEHAENAEHAAHEGTPFLLTVSVTIAILAVLTVNRRQSGDN